MDDAFARGEWPPASLLDLFAFSQHHGVPTRLLDFTSSYERAAYFAASSALGRPEEPNSRFVVWVLDMDFLEAAAGYSRAAIVQVTAPSAANAFLRAQRGFFLCTQRAASRNLDEVISRMARLAYALRNQPKIIMPTWNRVALASAV